VTLGSRSDRRPLFRARSDHPDMRSDNQLGPAVESPGEHEVPGVVRVWEPHRESHLAEKCLNNYLDGARQRRRNLPHKKQRVRR
jgi:hypothetical protein